MTRFLLGINYWPRSSAMYAWQRFDIGEIREDMARIRELGLDVVRFFLSWDAFAPEPDAMDAAMLGRFEGVMQAIADAKLAAMPTLFCGHMSGVNWLPAWALDPATPHGRFRTMAGGEISPYGIGDFYTDPKLLRAQTLFARSVGERARDHPALYAWDLGNEFSNMREPAAPVDAANWSLSLTETLREASGVGATGGTHGEDLERDRHLRPSSIAAPWAFASMHGYPVYSDFSRGRLDTDVVPFLAQVMQSCSSKPLLFTEFGNPNCPPGTVSPYDRVPLPGSAPNAAATLPANAAPYACLRDEEMASYAHTVLDRLHAAGTLGAFWWCWTDYDPKLASLPPFDEAPHEMRFGIVRNDGSLKPVAEVLSNFAREARDIAAAPPPIVAEDAYYAGLPKGIFELYREYCENGLGRALEPVARRMERVKLAPGFVAEALVPGTTLALNEVAMRWAGMPNKNERAALREVFDALTAAGYLEAMANDTWKVLRAAD